ncbi:MAG: ABC transporter substrate-binding protein [Candidatus Hodarchaeales archaeon]|jgi:ABC-type transport system substrate-binding protein
MNEKMKSSVKRSSVYIFLLLYFFFYSLEYNVYVDGFTNQDPDPLFSLTLVAPVSSVGSSPDGQLIEKQFPKIGIAAELDLISWSAAGPRCMDAIVGPYDENGFDITILGLSLGVINPETLMLSIFHESGLPPNGFNLMYWANQSWAMKYRAAESTALINDINVELNHTRARELLIDWQKVWYDAMPNVLIYNLYDIHAISTGLYGYDPFFSRYNPYYFPFSPSGFPLDSLEDIWTTTDYPTINNEMVILGVSKQADEFMNLLSTDDYDAYINGPILDSLVDLTPSAGIVLPESTNVTDWMITNYGTPNHLQLYPRMATSLGTWDATGTNYSLQIRDDVYWHDGHRFDAWDTVFSYQASLIPVMDTPLYSEHALIFGEDDPESFHGNYSFQVKDLDRDGFYETINFILENVHTPFEKNILRMGNYPEHVLGDPITHGFTGWNETTYRTSGWNFSGMIFDPITHWNVAPSDWVTHSFNTGNPADPGGYEGPLGTGSVVLYKNDLVGGWVELRKFEGIQWDNTTHQWNTIVSGMDSEHYLVTEGKLIDMPTKARTVVKTVNSGVAAMKTGDINILDPQLIMRNIVSELQVESTIQVVFNSNKKWQAMWFNPQFTVTTPLGDADRPFDRKGVRHAISHIVPRDDIINSLLDGLAKPTYTPISVTSPAVISQNDLISYKQVLLATDGSTPEANATTAHDDYNIDTALAWMASEGYDMRPWGGSGPETFSETTSSDTSESTTITSDSTTEIASISTSTGSTTEGSASSEASIEWGMGIDLIELIPLEILALISGVGVAALFERLKMIKG